MMSGIAALSGSVGLIYRIWERFMYVSVAGVGTSCLAS
jgi:hypothetical protein